MAGASRKLAVPTMQTLLCAQRTLSPAELLAAVTVDPTNGEVLVSSKDDLLDACCNMVLLDQEVSSFRFAHLSVREYLEGRTDYGPGITHLFMVDRCLYPFLVKSGEVRPGGNHSQYLLKQNETLYRYATWKSVV